MSHKAVGTNQRLLTPTMRSPLSKDDRKIVAIARVKIIAASI
jgi:hypothetical protein